MTASSFASPVQAYFQPRLQAIKAPQNMVQFFRADGEYKNVLSAGMAAQLASAQAWRQVGEAMNGVKLSSLRTNDHYVDLSGGKQVFVVMDGGEKRAMEMTVRAEAGPDAKYTKVSFSGNVEIGWMFPDKYMIKMTKIETTRRSQSDSNWQRYSCSYKYYVTVDDENGRRLFKQSVQDPASHSFKVEIKGHEFEISSDPLTVNKKQKAAAEPWNVIVQRLRGYFPFSTVSANDQYEVHAISKDRDNLLAFTGDNGINSKIVVKGHEISVSKASRGYQSEPEHICDCRIMYGPTYEVAVKEIRTGRTETYSIPADSPARIKIGGEIIGLYAKKAY